MFLSRYLKKYEKPVLFGIVILIAVTFGITSEMAIVADRSTAKPVLTYFGETLSAGEWQSFLARWRVLFQFLSPQERIPEEMLEQEARRLLVGLHEAKAAGIHVSDGEVAHLIRTAMEGTGRRYSRESYLTAINQRRVRVDEFEDTVRDLIRFQKFTNAARNSTSPPLSRVLDEYVKRSEEMRAQVVAFRARDIGRRLSGFSGPEIVRHFESQKSRYQIPDRLQIAYVMAGHDALLTQTTEPTEEELRKYYEENKQRWVIAAPIPEKKDEPGSQSEEKAGEPPQKGEESGEEHPEEKGPEEKKPAEEPAEKSPEDKDKDEDGEKDREEEPKPEEPKPGEPKYKPFEEVRAEIVPEVKKEAAQKLAIEKIEELERQVDEARLNLEGKEVDLEGLARKLGLEFDVSAFVSRSTATQLYDRLGFSQRFQQQAFSMEEGEYSGPMSSAKGWFLFRVLRKMPAEPARLTEDVRAAVIRDLQAKKGRDLAKEKSAAFAEAVRAATDKDLAEKLPAETAGGASERDRLTLQIREETFRRLAQEQKLALVNTDWFKRDGWIPGLKSYSRELAETAGGLAIGLAAAVNSFQDAYVVQVQGRRPPNSVGFGSQRDDLRTQLTDQHRRDYMRSFQEVLNDRAGLKMLEEKKEPPPEEGETEDHSGDDHGPEEDW